MFYPTTITGESPIYPPKTNNGTNTGSSDQRPSPDQRPEPRRDSDENRINDQIRVPRIRLIDEEGEMQGVFATKAAIEKAADLGLDLVEISPNADPPVCKIMDYGKFRYQQQKKKAEAKKKQKVIEIKELKLRPSIDTHDLETKMKAAMRFLDEGDKVKFTLRFRGREMAHQNLGIKLLARVKEILVDKIRVEQEPKFEGNQVIMVVSPAPAVVPAKPVPAAKPDASKTENAEKAAE